MINTDSLGKICKKGARSDFSLLTDSTRTQMHAHAHTHPYVRWVNSRGNENSYPFKAMGKSSRDTGRKQEQPARLFCAAALKEVVTLVEAKMKRQVPNPCFFFAEEMSR